VHYASAIDIRDRHRRRTVMSSRFFRASVLTVGTFSFLAWLYTVARIVINGVDVHWPFIDRFPSLSITVFAVITFLLSAGCMLTYLTLWGRFK
jgi:uncharacterized BrkB/YihY/UPF0761 family membrane protein